MYIFKKNHLLHTLSFKLFSLYLLIYNYTQTNEKFVLALDQKYIFNRFFSANQKLVEC